MLKKLGIPFVALMGMSMFAAPKTADAKVHFGVAVGAPPVYPYYQYCSPYDPYCSPYVYSYPYGYAYPQPYVYGGWGWGHRGHEWHEHHEFHEHHGGEHHHR
jgi:hypothetical protein